MKILFLQLPLLDNGYNYIQGNIPYAPAVISSFIEKYFNSAARSHLLPFVLENWASDKIIIKYILLSSPDIVCFTSYLWNIERAIEIARNLKALRKEIKIFFGGPEITDGSWVFSETHLEVDYFVSGEGEWFFDRYLRNDIVNYSRKINGNNVIIQPLNELTAPENIIEPFTNNRLNPMYDGSIFLELTRGCQWRCSYCNYSKNTGKIRELNFEILLKAIKRGENIDLKEIYILSPSFDGSKDFTGKLDALSSLNHSVSLHTEIRADNIDDNIARKMMRAGFRSCEIGVQTFNENALQRIGRKRNAKAEIQGMSSLKKSGIKLQIGIIPGLPGDDPGSFKQTIDALDQMGFADEIEFYPLMILPGTKLRDEAIIENIDFMKEPPYYLLNGWNFTFSDIQDSAFYIEKMSGYSLSPEFFPDFIFNENGILNRGILFNGDNIENWDILKYENDIETNVFTFYIQLSKAGILIDGLKKLLRPDHVINTLFNIILFSDLILNESELNYIEPGAAGVSFNQRLDIFTTGSIIQYCQVFTDIKQFIKSSDVYRCIRPILRVSENNLNAIKELCKTERPELMIPVSIFEKAAQCLKFAYSEACELLYFESEKDKKNFYSLIGADIVELPFDFKVKRYI